MNTSKIEIEWKREFLLIEAIRRDMQRRWKDSVYYSKWDPTADVIYAEEIDMLADILLQIQNRKD